MNDVTDLPVGLQLKRARQAQGLTLEDIALSTRIPVQALEAIEHDEWGRLPGMVYAKGFVKVYAAELALGPLFITSKLPESHTVLPRRQEGQGVIVGARHETAKPMPGSRGWALGGIAVAVFLVWFALDAMNKNISDEPTIDAAIPVQED